MAEGDLLAIYPNSDLTATPFRVDRNRQMLGATTINGSDGVFSSNVTITGDIAAGGGFRQRAVFSTTNVTISTNMAMALMSQTNNTEWPPITRAGSVVGIGVIANAPVTGGFATFYPVINGTRQSLTAALESTTSTTFAYATIAKDSLTFAAGARLGVTFSSNADWAPTTLDLIVGVDYEA